MFLLTQQTPPSLNFALFDSKLIWPEIAIQWQKLTTRKAANLAIGVFTGGSSMHEKNRRRQFAEMCLASWCTSFTEKYVELDESALGGKGRR